jgi:glyoxylase-like metal-dependent hydrolase (beta-lactamase superfamily II)
MRIKRWLWALAIIAVVLVSAKIVLLDTAASPRVPYLLDIEALHRAAIASGPLPERIEVERLGTFGFPKKIVVAGDGFDKYPMVVLSHRVVWPDRSLIIDTGASLEQTKKMPGAKLDEAAFERMQAALKKADTIIFTHEHSDHVGGLANNPELPVLVSRVRMTREQLNGPMFERKEFAPATLEKLQPLDYKGLHSVAPGVVVQKAPGHTVGSQVVYVELANGNRYLFIGDIAWASENITRERGRPKLAELLLKEDRTAVAAQLHTIHGLPPDIHVIVAHDGAALDRDIARGLVTKGFSNL